MHSYFAYGIDIKSEMQLPDMPVSESDRPPDVVVKYGQVEPLEKRASGAKLCVQFKNDEAYFYYYKLGMCRVRRGREIIGDPCEGVDQTALGFLAQGPGISVLLHQRGFLTLHASCVATEAGAVAFMGESGSGKSVLAAALHSAGYGLIADDVTVVDSDATEPIVYPGYPHCHLMRDAAEYFGHDADKVGHANAMQEKISLDVCQGFSIQPVVLRRVYVLAKGPDVRIQPLTGHRAVFELIRHSYWIRLMHDARPSSYFLQCGQLCEKVSVPVLYSPKSMIKLPELLTILKKDLLAA